MHAHERRRLVLAATFTMVAMPALWMLDRGGSTTSGAPGLAAAGFPEPLPLAEAPPADAVVTELPLFVDNTIVVVAPAVIDIVRPTASSERSALGEATYKRYVDSPVVNACTTRLAPAGATVTVTNLDNGQSTTCTNTFSMSVPAGAEIALDTDLFLTIADLVDAPVPVRLSW